MPDVAAKAKFLFDRDFTAGADAKQRPVPAAELAAKLAEAESKGYRAGFAAAQREEAAVSASRTAGAYERIGEALDSLARGLAEIEQKLETDAVQLAFSVGRKLAPELIARLPFAEIAALAGECFGQLSAAPHVVVRVNDAQLDDARQRLESIANTRGFQGRLVVIAEPEIGFGDCRIEWADGGVTRDTAKIDTAISTTIYRYLGARPTIDLPSLGDIVK